MAKKYTNKIYLLIIILLAVIFFALIYKSFLNINNAGGIKITEIKNQYSINENVILSGATKSNKEIILYLENKVGIIEPEINGRWTANLGQIPEGKYALTIVSDDSATSQSVTTAQIIVLAQKNSLSFVDVISNSLSASLSGFKKSPEKLIMVSTSAPRVLNGEWKLVK